MNDCFNKYKFIYKEQKPDTCPICGKRTIVKIKHENPIGKIEYTHDDGMILYVGTNHPLQYSWKCSFCGQPFCNHKHSINDSDYFYIYAHAFYGGIGSRPSLCFAITPKTLQGFCSTHGYEFKLDEDTISFFVGHQKELQTYKVERTEGIWYDDSIFSLALYSGSDTNSIVIDGMNMSKHPLLSDVISIVMKYHSEIQKNEDDKMKSRKLQSK